MVRAEYEFTKDAPNYEVAYREYELLRPTTRSLMRPTRWILVVSGL